MPRNSDNNATGLTARDVRDQMRALEEMYLGHCVLELRMAPTSFGRQSDRLVVVAANYVGVHRTARNTRAAVQHSFPSYRHKSLLGCMMGCLFELASELERERADARAAAAD
jgi:hypothetical protein